MQSSSVRYSNVLNDENETLVQNCKLQTPVTPEPLYDSYDGYGKAEQNTISRTHDKIRDVHSGWICQSPEPTSFATRTNMRDFV